MKPYIIKRPIITEKSVQQAQQNRVYTFEVERTAHKNHIKVAIEALYPVNVVSVKTVMIQAQEIRTGKKRSKVTTSKTKKAFVLLRKDQTIPLFESIEESAE